MRFDASAFDSTSSNSTPVSRDRVSKIGALCVGHRFSAGLPFVWIAFKERLNGIIG
jgi:hypothetical protein